MALTERGDAVFGTLTEWGEQIFGSLTESGEAVFGDGGAGPTAYTQSVGGVLSPSGAISCSIMLAENIGNAVITPVGTITKSIGKSLSGTLGPSGSVVKQTGKAMSGGISPSGTASQRSVYTQSAQGEITPSGVLSRAITALAIIGNAIITPVGTITKMIGKSVGGTIGSSGAISKQAGKKVSGSITPIGTITKGFVRAITVGEAVISFVGTLVYESVVVEIENLLNRAFKGLKNFFH